jgi:hypothetical protein
LYNCHTKVFVKLPSMSPCPLIVFLHSTFDQHILPQLLF